MNNNKFDEKFKVKFLYYDIFTKKTFLKKIVNTTDDILLKATLVVTFKNKIFNQIFVDQVRIEKSKTCLHIKLNIYKKKIKEEKKLFK